MEWCSGIHTLLRRDRSISPEQASSDIPRRGRSALFFSLHFSPACLNPVTISRRLRPLKTRLTARLQGTAACSGFLCQVPSLPLHGLCAVHWVWKLPSGCQRWQANVPGPVALVVGKELREINLTQPFIGGIFHFPCLQLPRLYRASRTARRHRVRASRRFCSAAAPLVLVPQSR